VKILGAVFKLKTEALEGVTFVSPKELKDLSRVLVDWTNK